MELALLPRRVDLQTTVNCPAPSLRPHYRALTATTSRSAPVPRIGTLPLAVSAACGSPSRGHKPWPSLSGRQVLLFHASACDELTPPIHRTPPGPHTGSSPTEGPPQRAFVPGPPTDPSFDAIVVSFRCVSSGSHMFVFSSHTRPAHSETSTAALTTPALDRRSLRWFGISACTATPEDLPPSLAQHGSCRRSSTSSSLPFRTHVGAGNSAMVVDLPRCGPMLIRRAPNLVPIPGVTGSTHCAVRPLQGPRDHRLAPPTRCAAPTGRPTRTHRRRPELARLGRGSAAALAPSKLRSASVISGRSTWRRSTPSWWRNTMISRSFERPDRTVSRASDARNRYKIPYTTNQHRPASRQVNDHGRVSGTHKTGDFCVRTTIRWTLARTGEEA